MDRVRSDGLSPATLWIERATARNRAVAVAARAVEELAELTRALARAARVAGDEGLAARLEEETASEERHVGQLLAMLDGLADGEHQDGTVESDRYVPDLRRHRSG